MSKKELINMPLGNGYLINNNYYAIDNLNLKLNPYAKADVAFFNGKYDLSSMRWKVSKDGKTIRLMANRYLDLNHPNGTPVSEKTIKTFILGSTLLFGAMILPPLLIVAPYFVFSNNFDSRSNIITLNIANLNIDRNDTENVIAALNYLLDKKDYDSHLLMIMSLISIDGDENLFYLINNGHKDSSKGIFKRMNTLMDEQERILDSYQNSNKKLKKKKKNSEISSRSLMNELMGMGEKDTNDLILEQKKKSKKKKKKNQNNNVLSLEKNPLEFKNNSEASSQNKGVVNNRIATLRKLDEDVQRIAEKNISEPLHLLVERMIAIIPMLPELSMKDYESYELCYNELFNIMGVYLRAVRDNMAQNELGINALDIFSTIDLTLSYVEKGIIDGRKKAMEESKNYLMSQLPDEGNNLIYVPENNDVQDTIVKENNIVENNEISSTNSVNENNNISLEDDVNNDDDVNDDSNYIVSSHGSSLLENDRGQSKS